MIDMSMTLENLEETQKNLSICRKWFHLTLQQPYTVAEMSATLEYYWNNHIAYYSNKPGQMPEKQQRIFRMENRLQGDHFKQTQDFNVKLAADDNKLATLQAEIARYEHPFLYFMQGRYCDISKSDGKGFQMVIPNMIDCLKENHSPYFEFIFDENFHFKEEPFSREFYDFFCDVHYLEFLRRKLADLQKTLSGRDRVVKPLYNSFKEVFKAPNDFEKTVAYLQSINILADDGTYIEVTGNKKYLALLPKVLKLEKRIKPITDKEFARLMGEAFSLTIAPDYISKNFGGREALVEEMRKDLRFQRC